MKVTDIKQNTSMLFNITLCKACLQRLVATNKFVRLKSHYAVLGVSNTATQKQIRDAYLKLSKQHHPDQNRQDPKSHEKFVKINEAYEVLSKDSSRRSYDDSVRVRNQPRPNFRTSHRPPNYYSSGQFYEDQGPFSDHNQYDPYSKRNAGSHYDPFSSYGYEHYQRQRRHEEYKPDDFGIDWEFRQKVSTIYSLLILLPFYLGVFYAFNDMCKPKTNRSRSHEFFSDAALKRLVVFYVLGYVIIPYFVLAKLFAYIFRGSYSYSDPPTDRSIILVALLISFHVLAYIELYRKLMEDNNNFKANTEYIRIIRSTILILVVPYLLLRSFLLYMVTSEKAFGSGGQPRYTNRNRIDRKAQQEELTRQLQYIVSFVTIFACVLIFIEILTEDRSIIKRQGSYSYSDPPTDRSIILVALLISFHVLAYIELYRKLMEDYDNFQADTEYRYIRIIRSTILILVVPYLLLRGFLLYMVTSEKAFGSRGQPRYTNRNRIDRKAQQEELTRQLQYFVSFVTIFACVLIFIEILTEDRSIITRQQQQAENGGNGEKTTSYAMPEESEHDDGVLVAFHRIWWTMAILMAIFMLWEVIIHAHIKVTTHGLVYDDTPRRRIIPEDTFAYFQVVTLITLVLCSIRENYRQRRRKEAEAWERGSASKSKMLFYLGLYATVVFFFSKQEIERRKQLKEQKSADKTKVYSKVTVGKDSS